jgi:prepilin-type N-terminal cleavage/methylation domain-containing protein/prepilin-type processing-associated H-X9-DG protein
MAQTAREPAYYAGLRGFTLVELLVVISIIALMTSILLPSLTRAQEQAQRTHCLANQHQLMLVWSMYNVDNEGRLCRPAFVTGDLQRYTKIKDIVTECKSIDLATGIRRSYGVSNTMGGEARDNVRPYGKFPNIARPSSSLVFIDIQANANTCFWPLLRTADDSEDMKDQVETEENDVWMWRPFSWPASNSIQGMTARHSNGCNMSFADGHGQYYRWEDARTLKLIKGRIADPEKASADNTDLDYLVRAQTRD